MTEKILHTFDNLDQLLESLADFVVAKSKHAIAEEGRFSFVLSGGSSPKRLYELLASDKYKKQIDWTNVFFFFGDERYVPATDAQSNFLMVKKALFEPLEILPNQVYAINTTLSPDDSALSYQNDIKSYFKDKPTRFDFILLGLGDNVHTASLFPHTSILHEQNAFVKGLFIEEVKMNRISLTAPIINKANAIVFLVYGASKAEAVKHALSDAKDIEEYPAQLIQAETGELHWFLDDDAAKFIK